MKKADFTLEFISHCLANGSKRCKGRSIFEKDSTEKLIWQKSWWYTALRKAIEEGNFRSINPNNINVSLVIDAPIRPYKRRANGQAVYSHEAIYPGTQVTFEAVVADNVTQETLEDLLVYTGRFIGVTPFGYNLGYGLFEVIEVNVEPSIS